MDECSICKLDMHGIVAFEAPLPDSAPTDVLLDDTAFRLKCGHAFHCACLCQAFRSNSLGCPVCRISSADAASGTLNMIINIDAEGNIALSNEDDEDYVLFEEEEENEPEFVRAEDIAAATATLSALQEAKQLRKRQKLKAHFNQTLKDYRNFENLLMLERKNGIEGALNQLRRKYHQEYLYMKRKSAKALQALRRYDRNFIKRSDTSLLDYFDKSTKERYLFETYIEVAEMNPCRYRFWNHSA